MDPLDRLVIFLNFVLAASAVLLAIWGVVLGLRAHYRIDAMRRGGGAYSGPQQQPAPPPPPARPQPSPHAAEPALPPSAYPQAMHLESEEPATGPIGAAAPPPSALESQDAPTQQLRAQRPHLPRPGDL